LLRGILLLLIIALVSGSIAYLGNKLGRYVGKKKLSIFNLRPLHTSTLFTIATGALISLLTIGVASMLSENVRIALFGMEKLQRERIQLQDQVSYLSAQTNQGKILFTTGQSMALSLIPGGMSEEKTKVKLLDLIKTANKRAVEKNNSLAYYFKTDVLPEGSTILTYSPEDFNNVLKLITNSSSEWGIIISASTNVFLGNKFSVDIKAIKNIVIYREGEEITSIKIDAARPKNEILAQLFTLIYKTQENSTSRGMMRDPEQQLSMPSAVALYDFVKRVQEYGGWVQVRALAKRNLFVVDAPDIRLTIESTTAPEGQ